MHRAIEFIQWSSKIPGYRMMVEDEANIWVAASDGDIERVKSLIVGGCSVNAQDSNGYSPM